MRLSYLLIRLFTLPLGYLPYRALHRLGASLGLMAYHLLPKFRKRTLSNLALASALALSNNEIVKIAKESFQNLMITLLEYPKLARENHPERIATLINPEEVFSFLNQKKGVIIFCGHQANWEILFLLGTKLAQGVAIGRPIKNPYLYKWILSIREKFGGTIIAPKEAIRKSLQALKQGKFVGIVGDQGMPDSGFQSPFLGRLAWTSPAPALLSERTGCPLFVTMCERKNGKYEIRFSPALYPTDGQMHEALSIYEESIKRCPGQWLWQHNRWKQQTPGKLKKAFRHDSLLVILENIPSNLSLLRTLYPHEFITLLLPSEYRKHPPAIDAELLYYSRPEEVLLDDYRFKLVLNFTHLPHIKRHYEKLSAISIFTFDNLQTFACACH